MSRRRPPRVLLGRGVKAGAVAYDGIRPPRRGVVVLLYHRVGGRSGLEVDLPTPLFEAQMESLAASGRARTIDDALAALAATDPASDDDPVVVTFDDGTEDVLDIALPILERLAIPAILFIATDFVERETPFPNDGRPASWAGLRAALATGLVSVGSHTHRHRLLDRLPADEVADELDRSVGLITDRLGVRPRHFAYPKAVIGSSEVEGAVRARFASAALAGTRPNLYGRTDPYRLARSPIQVSDGMTYFERKLAGGMVLEDRLRSVLNRGRYAGRVT